MISIIDNTKCCGCAACVNICHKSALQMKEDKEGFDYPEIVNNSCVNCGLCEKVCPMLQPANTEQHNASLHVGIQYKADSVRMESTAGGAFSLIAEEIISMGGVVYAADYDHMVVVHKAANKVEELNGMRGSKYVQSKIGDSYSAIKKLLSKNIKVLFTGTPCQVQGLLKCVGSNENLYTIDLLCLGVSSPGLFSNWVKWLQSNHHCEVDRVYFRNKRFGYSTSNVRVLFANGKKIEQTYESKCHPNTFFKAYNVRPSCYECRFREVPRVSDFTIGDFIQIGNYSKKMDDDKGTTSLWIHSLKAKNLFYELEGKSTYVVIENQSSNVIGGPAAQMIRPTNRDSFFFDANNLNYGEFIGRWIPRNIKSDFASIARIVINCMPFSKVVFKALRKRKSKEFSRQVEKANR